MSRLTNSAELANAIRETASHCVTEMELQIGVEKLLDPLLKQLPLRESMFNRATRLGGIPDALHGNVIIEYERPGKLKTKQGVKEPIRQLKQYLQESAGNDNQRDQALRRMVGVGLDGEHILFIRYRGGCSSAVADRPRYGQLPIFPEDEPQFSVDGPHRITADTIDLFVGYLQSLARHPLTAEALAETFGPKSEVAQRVVRLLYDKVVAAEKPRVSTFFAEWQRIFGIIYGQDMKKAEAEARALANQFGITKVPRLKEFLFAIHTYFALLMKLLAAEIMTMQRGSTLQSFIQPLLAMDSGEFRAALEDLEDGGLFSRQEITNFLEGDFFSWYVSVWDGRMAHELRFLAKVLGGFDPRTPDLAPEHSRDLLKKLYQYLVPKKLRHDLGEYYTPDWLAEHLLDEIGYSGDVDSRILDPACGSGTFLVLAIKRAKRWAEDHDPPLSPTVAAKKILRNLCGFDLNPIAVIAARTNFLLAFGELIRYVRPIEIPVYICDSVLTPAKHRSQRKFPEICPGYELSTRAGTFVIPREIVDRGEMDRFAWILESCVRNVNGYTSKDFVRLVKKEIGIRHVESPALLEKLHSQIAELERAGRNRIWARFIKNSFAPVFKAKERFHFVVGNPPWVNWENLAEEYRQETADLWRDYGFFTQKGYRAVVPAGKLDVAALFTYASADSYLRPDGRLGFVITQSLFKSRGAGEGFRKFCLPDNVQLRVNGAYDLIELNPFEGAQNRTAMVILQKGQATNYPVAYQVWLPKPEYLKVRRDSAFEPQLADVKRTTEIVRLIATPIDATKDESPWLTIPSMASSVCRKVIGNSQYRAREGVNTLGANAVYWLRVKEKHSGLLLVQNEIDGAKKKVARVPPTLIESDLVYPLLRGQDVSRWHAEPSLAILMTHAPATPKVPIDCDEFKRTFHRAHKYLVPFHQMLSDRARVKKLDLGWHTLGEVGAYTFSPYKLVWREQAAEFTAAVIGSTEWHGTSKLVIPDHKLMLISCETNDEAHYLCGVMNSSLVRLIVKGYVVETSTSVHVMEHIAVPKFDPNDSQHLRVAALSKRAHRLVATGPITPSETREDLKKIEQELDSVVAETWGVNKTELQGVGEALRILGLVSGGPGKKAPSSDTALTKQARFGSM